MKSFEWASPSSVGEAVSLLQSEAAHSVATPQIRNLGTVGGNLCQRPRCWYYRLEEAVCLKKGGSECFAAKGENKYNAILGGGPSYIVHPSDLAPVLVALGASASVVGADGKRTVPLEKFFTLHAFRDACPLSCPKPFSLYSCAVRTCPVSTLMTRRLALARYETMPPLSCENRASTRPAMTTFARKRTPISTAASRLSESVPVTRLASGF